MFFFFFTRRASLFVILYNNCYAGSFITDITIRENNILTEYYRMYKRRPSGTVTVSVRGAAEPVKIANFSGLPFGRDRDRLVRVAWQPAQTEALRVRRGSGKIIVWRAQTHPPPTPTGPLFNSNGIAAL